MKHSAKVQMYQQIEQHGADLNVIFNTGIDNIALCKKLRTLEKKAHRLSTDYCNGENGINSHEDFEKKCELILKAIDKILFAQSFNVLRKKAVFVNGDARGYALKLSDKYVRENNLKIYTDMGGYGILAPDFTPNK